MKARAASDLLLRAVRRQEALLGAYGLTPKGRAEWAQTLGKTSLADELRRRVQGSA
jgi:hypothetical protein